MRVNWLCPKSTPRDLCSVISLCGLCDLCDSVISALSITHDYFQRRDHRDAEIAEIAKNEFRTIEDAFRGKAGPLPACPHLALLLRHLPPALAAFRVRRVGYGRQDLSTEIFNHSTNGR